MDPAQNQFNRAVHGDADLIVYSSGNMHNLDVLQRAYDEIYAPNFPRSAGYHSLEGLMKLMRPESPNDCRIFILGENVRDKEQGKIKGICVSFYYKDSDTGQLTYLAVKPEYRTEGIGNKLFHVYEDVILQTAKDNGGPLKGHYITCQNPAMAVPAGHEYDTYNPQKRFDKYVAWGGRQVPGDFILGYKIGDQLHVEDHYSLLAFPHPVSRQYPDANTNVSFVQSVWRVSVPDVSKQPAFQRMAQSMRAHKKSSGAPDNTL